MANINDNFNHLKNKLIFKKYKLTKLIGKGSFGCVFKGNNIIDNTEVAVKLERKNYKVHLLEIESNFLTILKGYGIPEIKGFGYCGNYYVLIQELLGLNLMQIKYLKNFRYSLKDISILRLITQPTVYLKTIPVQMQIFPVQFHLIKIMIILVVHTQKLYY